MRSLVCALLLVLGIFFQSNQAGAASAVELEATADRALAELFRESPDAKALLSQSHAYLVFPKIIKGGLIIGGQYGEGVLRVRGETKGFYSTSAISYGLQIGGQVFGYLMVFKDQAALDYLSSSDGWDVGSAPTAVFGDEGWSGSLTVSGLEKGIGVLFFNQKGAMAGAGLQGTKIQEIMPDQ